MTERRPDLTWVFETLNSEFEDKFKALGGRFEAGVTRTHVDAEVVFDGPTGPVWHGRVRYAESGDPLGNGPYRSVMPVDEALSSLREQINDFLQRLRPAVRGKTWDGRDVITVRDRESLIAELINARTSGDKARADVLREGLRMFGISID